MHTVKIIMSCTSKLTIQLSLIIAIHIHSTRPENIKIQSFNNDLKNSILNGNNTKLNELAPQYNNELVAYNQLLPYLYSKLPIPTSLINQLRKYNINKNMLNKIHSYNKLRRELHSKLIENEINGYKYNDILSKKLKTLFKSVNQEEKKNFLNLINYLKMFNFENNKLYNTLHDGNDLFKLINDNKMKYLPFINTDKTLPDLFINNKVNKEIRRILIQYKISSKDLYDKLINKINPYLLEDMNKKSLGQISRTENKVQLKDIEANNPYELLKERIEDLTSFRKKPRILPLNEDIQKKNNVDKNARVDNNAEKKEVEIDASLNKYINDLRLMNEIEKERNELVNMKIDHLTNPNKNNARDNAALLQPNPNAELLALYMVLSIPGLLSALPSRNKRLPHIKKTKEDILQHSHIEADKLYNQLIKKNTKDSLKKIHDAMKEEKYYNKLGGFDIDNFNVEKVASENKKGEDAIKMGHHPFGHQHSHNLVSDNNYYDAPQLPQYETEPLNCGKGKQINGHALYSALRSKSKWASRKLTVNDNNKMAGNNIFHVLSNTFPKDVQENHVDFKVNGNQLFAHLHNGKNNIEDSLYKEIDRQALFDKLKAQGNKGGWIEDTVYSKNSDKNNQNKGMYIDGKELFNLMSDKNVGISKEKNMKTEVQKEHHIKGQDLFDLFDPSDTEYKVQKIDDGKPKLNMDKFYQKLYQKFVKDNKGTLNAMDTQKHKNKAVWHHQNVEVPNISAVDMNDNKKENIVRAENENDDHDSNQGKYNLQSRKIVMSNKLDNSKSLDINALLKPLETDLICQYQVGNKTANMKRSRRSFYDDFSSFELRERQATLGYVLDKILNQFKITDPRKLSDKNTEKFTFPFTPSSWINLDLTPFARKQNLGYTTDFMFSKDADIDASLLAEFYRSLATTTSQTTTAKLTLADIAKPKKLNKELLLLRIHHLRNALCLKYSYTLLSSRIKDVINRPPPNVTFQNTDSKQENSSLSLLRETNYSESLGSFQDAQTYQPTTFETFRPYSTFRSRISTKTEQSQNKTRNKVMIEKRLRSNMLPDVETYHADRRILENNGTYIVRLSNKDKIVGAEYVDDLLALYPDDPDILHRKFNKEQLEKQIRNYNAIFDELSEETKRKYYITLDIYSRMDHIEQVKTGGKIVILNANEKTPSSDEMKVLYDEFSNDFTDNCENYSDKNFIEQRRIGHSF